jgi:hypothetical protein
VIIGRKTASAAQCLATQIERNASAIFVGEPTGSCPNFVGETRPLNLPYSKKQASISDLYWQNSVVSDVDRAKDFYGGARVAARRRLRHR